jgi:hypothetical protein
LKQERCITCPIACQKWWCFSVYMYCKTFSHSVFLLQTYTALLPIWWNNHYLFWCATYRINKPQSIYLRVVSWMALS